MQASFDLGRHALSLVFLTRRLFLYSDMLEVGNKGLSVPEARTHFALWCLVKSPLLIGADLTKITAPYLAILTSKELIAISQDTLGKQGRLVDSKSNSARDTLPLPRSTMPAAGVTDEDYLLLVARLRAQFGGVTDCSYDGIKVNGTMTAVGAEQKWLLDDATGTIRNKPSSSGSKTTVSSIGTPAAGRGGAVEGGAVEGGAVDLCLTVSTPSGTSNKTDVTIASCVAGSTAQKWRGFGDVTATTAPLMSVLMEAANMSACLATNGSSLFVEPCVQDPVRCSTRGPDCPQSVRMPQLWYAMRNGQLLSTVTSEFQIHGRCSAQAMPKCVSTRPNSAPIRPPSPPAGPSPRLPLQVWAGPLSGGRLAVALVNAGDSTAQIDATWTVLGIKNGTTMNVRDATAGTANGTADGLVSAQVASHDTVVLTLAPIAEAQGMHR
jgi:hypothetical protein